MNSDRVLKGVQQAPHRSLFNALGFTASERQKPLIGICSRPGENDKFVSYINVRYADAVQDAGGIPIALPHGFGVAGMAGGSSG